ncbi:MAG: T9SS type A sorting domain-containing protein [candidate division WOR-3 bacterium]|nr:MAG: T9SS type A sorting domain-containing protein [candidate division WOR-3 bacterium]
MERETLAAFLNSGKGLYIEGCDFGAQNQGTPLYNMFGTTFQDPGAPVGNVSSVTGQSGSLVDGMFFSYLYEDNPDRFVDILTPNGGSLLFESQDSSGRTILYSGPSDSYRAINSSIIFSGLRDSTHTKLELMSMYMDYLSSTTGTQEYGTSAAPLFYITPNPFSRHTSFVFTLKQAEPVDIAVYNTAGQKVNQLVNGMFLPGTHTVSWDGRDHNGRVLGSGTYVARVTLNRTTFSHTIALLK